jgi:hypothetical protein
MGTKIYLRGYIMKKLFLLIIVFFVMSMHLAQSESVDISVGGAFTGYLIPTVSFYNYETTIANPARVSANDYVDLMFGFAVTAPVVATYYFNNGWGVGGSVELGYSFQAGPQVYMGNPPANYVPSDTAHFFHAFYGLFNFAVKTPKLKYDFRIVMELGLLLRGGGMLGWNRNYLYTSPLGSGTTSVRALCYAGPDFFIGFQKEVTPSLVIMPGFRFSSEFSGYYDTYPNTIYREFYVQVNFGLECRIMWNKNIPITSGGGGGTKSNTTKKSKTKKPADDEKKEDFK